MDEYHQEFKRAWAADHRMTGERLNWPKGAWPYEGGGYWFDGLARLGYVLHDDALMQQAKRRLDVVVDHMNPDSILFLWWLDKNRPGDVKGGHRRRRLAHVGLRPAGARHGRLLRRFGRPARVSRRWKPATAETAMGAAGMAACRTPGRRFETYTWTGNPQIGGVADGAVLPNDGSGNRDPWSWSRYRRMPNPQTRGRSRTTTSSIFSKARPHGHWATCGPASVSSSTRRWPGTTCSQRVAMQPSGVPVADEYYGPTGAFRGTETCDVAGYLWSQIVLLTVSGEGRMADRAERAFFNAGPATVARDFKTHVYFQSPNRVADNSPPCPHGPRASGRSYKPHAFPAVLHGRAEPHRAQLRDAHVDGHVRQRAGGHLLRPMQGLGAGGRPRAGRDRMPDRLSLPRVDRDDRPAGPRSRPSRSRCAFPAGAGMPN